MLITLTFFKQLGSGLILQICLNFQGFRGSKFLNSCLLVWTSNLRLLSYLVCGVILSPAWKQTAKLVFEKTVNLHKLCTMTIFIRLLHLVISIADVELLTTIDYYDWLLFHGRIRDHTKTQLFNLFQSGNLQLQITIHSSQQQTNMFDCRIDAVANAF